MKFTIKSLATLSFFCTGLSLKCHTCNYPYFNNDDLQCHHPKEGECENGAVCGKLTGDHKGADAVIKTCLRAGECERGEFARRGNGGFGELLQR